MNAGTPVTAEPIRQRPGTAILIDQLQPPRINAQQHRAGCETWACCWAPDGSYFAWSCGNCQVKLIPWDRHRHSILLSSEDDGSGSVDGRGHTVRTIDAGELVWAVSFGSDQPNTLKNSINLGWSNKSLMSSQNLVLATGLQSGVIKTWDVSTGFQLQCFKDHTEVIRDVAFSPDGQLRLVSASRDGTLKLWNKSGALLSTLHSGVSKWMYACCWSPDSALLASAGDNQCVMLWDMNKLEPIRLFTGHNYDVCGCDFSPDGALLATSSYDTRVIVWDVHLGVQLMELRHQYPAPTLILAAAVTAGYIRAVSFSRDGRHLSTVSDDGYIRFWDIFNKDMPRQVATVTTPLCCRFSPDGAVLAVGTRNGIVTMWMAPMQVSSLQHMCRLSIRRLLASDKLKLLNIPDRLRRFLEYNAHW